MKILHITFNKGLGGLEQMFLNYAEAFTSFGWSVVNMLPRAAALSEVVDRKNMELIETSLISSSSQQYNPFARYKMRHILKKINPDLVLLHNTRPYPLLAKAAKNICPVAVVNHSDNIHKIKRLPCVVAITHYTMSDLHECEAFTGKSYYVPNVVDSFIQPSTKKRDKQKLTLGYIGRFTPEKGLRCLIESAQHYGFDYEVVIAGGGEERDELEALVNKLNVKAEFIGWVDKQKKQDFFNQIDVLVVPSHNEAFGLVIAEGWAANVPVISTKTRGGAELIEHSKNGLLCEVGSPESLAEAVKECHTLDLELLAHNATESLSDYSQDVFRKQLKLAVEAICAN